MAFKRNLQGETLPEKVVIVTGPTLGTILSFIAFGAVIGAAGALFWRNSQSTPAAGEDSFGGFGEAGGEQRMNSIVERLNKLQTRIKSLASRTRDTVSSATEVLGPVLHDAVNEAKNAARDAEKDLQDELSKPQLPVEPLNPEEAKGAGDPAI